jgi:hypothetical protein
MKLKIQIDNFTPHEMEFTKKHLNAITHYAIRRTLNLARDAANHWDNDSWNILIDDLDDCQIPIENLWHCAAEAIRIALFEKEK